MGIADRTKQRLQTLSGSVLTTMFDYAKRMPFVKDRIEAEFESMMKDLRKAAKPYRDQLPTQSRLPETGVARDELLEQMRSLQELESDRWRDGFVSGAVYHGASEHIDFLNEVYAMHSQTNPLHSDLWPSVVKYEAEVVSMTAQMLGAAHVSDPDEVCGTVTSGGTESIMLAMKTYRDWGRAERGIRHPEMVVPVTAHAAFDKAAHAFGIKQIKVPVTHDMVADLDAVKRSISRSTVVVVGSAPAFPHGVIDPIAAMSELALQRGIGFHTDACLGGFVLPWARRLGYEVPKFDFSLPGVTSMSADTHKYGYAAKGTSVVLYRRPSLRRHQWYTTSDWPGGLYMSPTFAGSRPGALSAACWAALMSMGEQGYLAATKKILDTADVIKKGIAEIDGVRILGNPLWVIAFDSEDLDIYKVMDFMTKRHWNLNGLHRPSCVHLCVTLRHAEEGVAQRFLSDLREAVAHVRANPSEKGGMAPMYGMAATLPVRGAVSDMLERYLDVLYEV